MFYLITFLIASLFFTLLISTEKKYKNRKRKPTESEEELALTLSREELNKSLNFMLMYGVIDYKEYNQIERKSLPYVSR